MNSTLPSKPRYSGKEIKDTTVVQTVAPSNSQKHKTNIKIDAACPICQEPVGQRTPEGKKESWSKLPCGHKFGSHCIKHWLGLRTEDQPCCPICRQNASHRCGHPVLPELVTGHEKQPTTEVEKLRAAMNKPDMLQYSSCVFCRLDPSRGRKKKRGKPWRFVKGCWRLVRHGRMRERPPPNRPFSLGLFTTINDAAWERWWSNQEPKNV